MIEFEGVPQSAPVYHPSSVVANNMASNDKTETAAGLQGTLHVPLLPATRPTCSKGVPAE
jgi:hypothetical protein